MSNFKSLYILHRDIILGFPDSRHLERPEAFLVSSPPLLFQLGPYVWKPLLCPCFEFVLEVIIRQGIVDHTETVIALVPMWER